MLKETGKELQKRYSNSAKINFLNGDASDASQRTLNIAQRNQAKVLGGH